MSQIFCDEILQEEIQEYQIYFNSTNASIIMYMYLVTLMRTPCFLIIEQTQKNRRCVFIRQVLLMNMMVHCFSSPAGQNLMGIWPVKNPSKIPSWFKKKLKQHALHAPPPHQTGHPTRDNTCLGPKKSHPEPQHRFECLFSKRPTRDPPIFFNPKKERRSR